MAPLIKLDTLILDVSSVKGEVVRVAQSISGMAKHFVPCHPMAGKEKSGPGNADPRLYQGKFVFITPLSMTPASLVQRASQFWKKVGAVPIVTTAPIHDRSVALTSHLPHLLASAFMELYGRHHGRSPVFRKALGSGFRDFTRIAASHPAMWRDIMEMNAGEIKLFLTQYRHLLAKLEKNLARDKGSFWLSFFKKARMLREKI
jgi:prephenate dehydrogenase